MNIPDEVQKKADDLYWDRDKSHGGFGCAEEAYEYVAEWARKEALREAAERVRDYWDACGELIDSNNGARLAFDAVAEQIAEDPS